jgi:ADP-ribosyl-[dinitrogen reductase] hydrolase
MKGEHTLRGAIIGDIAGSVYEWHNIKTKDFPFYSVEHRCKFTDDTVLTCAVAHAVLEADRAFPDREPGELAFIRDFQSRAEHNYRSFAIQYEGRGYGGHFLSWAYDLKAGPYGSAGNGAAMRVSPVAWAARSAGECMALAAASALPTHNSPDGIAGAQAAAMAAWCALHGGSAGDIRRIAALYYPMDFTIDGIREDYSWGSCCFNTVPMAIECALEAAGFEDAIRNAISIGGDSDTIAAITGPIAEAMFGVPGELWRGAEKYFHDKRHDDFLPRVEAAFHKRYAAGSNGRG